MVIDEHNLSEDIWGEDRGDWSGVWSHRGNKRPQTERCDECYGRSQSRAAVSRTMLIPASHISYSTRPTVCLTKGSRTISDRSSLTARVTMPDDRLSCVSWLRVRILGIWAALTPVSATWPESVRRLASTFLKDPIRVTVGSDELTANKRIEQIVEVIDDPRQKESVESSSPLPLRNADIQRPDAEPPAKTRQGASVYAFAPDPNPRFRPVQKRSATIGTDHPTSRIHCCWAAWRSEPRGAIQSARTVQDG